MKRIILVMAGLWVAIGAGAGQVAAQDAPMAQSTTAAADKTSPSYDMKAQAIVDLQGLEKKYVGLAEAIPAEKYTWRPAAGVRSIEELFLHISAANFNIPTMMGAAGNAATKQKDYEKSITDKAKIIEQVKLAFANAIAVTQGMSNADFAKPEKKLGPDANDGDVIYLLVTHAHEHLGQAIAYARMNGVVPPWTAAAMKKAPGAPKD